jgi:transcriptional regulator with XRE-family HTH domain
VNEEVIQTCWRMTSDEMRQIRNELGWSQQRLAQELGMSLSRIADYERGVTRGARPRPVQIPRTVELAMEALRNRHE